VGSQRYETKLTHRVAHPRLDPLPAMSEHVHDSGPAERGDDGKRDLSRGNRCRVALFGSERRQGVGQWGEGVFPRLRVGRGRGVQSRDEGEDGA
jgi:hypothetical protein